MVPSNLVTSTIKVWREERSDWLYIREQRTDSCHFRIYNYTEYNYTEGIKKQEDFPAALPQIQAETRCEGEEILFYFKSRGGI